ncbi:hypothetical protein I7I48_07835 [Histoplasma ohiense]|nr:hypothetical protein I7I48_07835 [Histoplasma ohiense (nom. inval.)]
MGTRATISRVVVSYNIMSVHPSNVSFLQLHFHKGSFSNDYLFLSLVRVYWAYTVLFNAHL